MRSSLLRSGHLTSVEVPSIEQDAVRGLVRYRDSVIQNGRRRKQRVSGFLLRQDLRLDRTKSAWTTKYRAWIAQVRRELEGPAEITLALQLEHLEYLEAKLRVIGDEIERVSRCEPYRQVVDTLQFLRGLKTLPAMTLANEIVAIATKAQHRASKKLWRLWERRHPRVAVVPVARELCGFVWANMNAAPQHSPRRSKESGPRGEVR